MTDIENDPALLGSEKIGENFSILIEHGTARRYVCV